VATGAARRGRRVPDRQGVFSVANQIVFKRLYADLAGLSLSAATAEQATVTVTAGLYGQNAALHTITAERDENGEFLLDEQGRPKLSGSIVVSKHAPPNAMLYGDSWGKAEEGSYQNFVFGCMYNMENDAVAYPSLRDDGDGQSR
jgi:hypothetical protein